jgi:hypothetical protein
VTHEQSSQASQEQLIRTRKVHGDYAPSSLVWCAECGSEVSPTHFGLGDYSNAHPRALQGISARDLAGYQRRDGDGRRRTARWLLERRDRDVRGIALDLKAAGSGWDNKLEEELRSRPNIIREQIGGHMRGAGQPVLTPDTAKGISDARIAELERLLLYERGRVTDLLKETEQLRGRAERAEAKLQGVKSSEKAGVR